MSLASLIACPRCRKNCDAGALVCVLCGELLRRPTRSPAQILSDERIASAAASAATPNMRAASAPRGARTRDTELAETDVGRTPWIYLAIGLATAPVFAWTPILQYMGWFLSSLVHEMGHAAFAWLCGMPAMPAISLGGHAAAMHGEQMPFLVVMIVAGLSFVAWRRWNGGARWCALTALAVVYPALALTPARELLHLLAGHGGELVFATLCLWKTLDGGFTESRVERGLYGMLGWYLLGSNAWLFFGLMRSSIARAEYGANGSFGLTNDMIRAAEDVLGWRLESVALLMFVACLAVLPVAIAGWRACVHLRRADAE